MDQKEFEEGLEKFNIEDFKEELIEGCDFTEEQKAIFLKRMLKTMYAVVEDFVQSSKYPLIKETADKLGDKDKLLIADAFIENTSLFCLLIDANSIMGRAIPTSRIGIIDDMKKWQARWKLIEKDHFGEKLHKRLGRQE